MSTTASHFPGDEWETRPAPELGFDPEKLAAAHRKLAEVVGPEGPYRACVVRNGHIAAEWNAGVEVDERIEIASAQKSVYSCLLGIAIGEGKIPSADALACDYYPEMLEVPEGTGPKPNRSNKPEDAQITFRHLITNTSGYLKPGERPGEQYHYQSFGMCILMHAIGKVYGVYDSSDPEGSAGEGELIREKIRDKIGASWTWSWGNFDLPPEARMGIYGYHTKLSMTTRDMCRLGWLWRNFGNWEGRQVVPEEWLREATVAARIASQQSSSDPLTHGSRAYGHGFWCNDEGQLWPDFPRDSFAAAGAWNRLIWVCPSLDLVVAQNPGIRAQRPVLETRVLNWVLDALTMP
jgi:CubicO group peptidase (beta-lactamase class C family)